MIKNPFAKAKPPTVEQIREQMYNEAQIALLDAECTLERAQATRDMLARRVNRLKTVMNQGLSAVRAA
jgi:hypothetical protein